MLSGVAAGAAWPGLAAGHPVLKHLASPSTLDMAEAQAATADWKPEFLSPEQAQSLAALVERIIPGSAQAQSDRFIDLLLSVDTKDNQQHFLKSLDAMEEESKKRFHRAYHALTEAQQNEVLTAASKAKSGHDAAAPRRRRRGATPGGATGVQEQDTMRDHFENLKGWTVGAYYSSEAGMRELGWTDEVMFESFPGCDHPGGHA